MTGLGKSIHIFLVSDSEDFFFNTHIKNYSQINYLFQTGCDAPFKSMRALLLTSNTNRILSIGCRKDTNILRVNSPGLEGIQVFIPQVFFFFKSCQSHCLSKLNILYSIFKLQAGWQMCCYTVPPQPIYSSHSSWENSFYDGDFN